MDRRLVTIRCILEFVNSWKHSQQSLLLLYPLVHRKYCKEKEKKKLYLDYAYFIFLYVGICKKLNELLATAVEQSTKELAWITCITSMTGCGRYYFILKPSSLSSSICIQWFILFFGRFSLLNLRLLHFSLGFVFIFLHIPQQEIVRELQNHLVN